jgi:hypothetical protein
MKKHIFLVLATTSSLAISGCLNPLTTSAMLQPPSGIVQPPPGQLVAPRERVVTKESKEAGQQALRVARLGRELLEKNSGLGIKPIFQLLGGSSSEIFHRETYQIYVSEGLAARSTDAQLSALLAEELALAVVEAKQTSTGRTPIDLPIERGGGSFGPADGVRMAELARSTPRRDTGPTMDPSLMRLSENPLDLAREILRRSGQDPVEIEACRALSLEAHEDSPRRKQLTARRS